MGSGNVVPVTSALAMPAGTTAAIVPMSAAEAAATPSLRTMAHPLCSSIEWFRARIVAPYSLQQWAVGPIGPELSH